MQLGTVKRIFGVDNPRVSIIIPSMKTEETLAPLWDEIRAQTEKSLEVILVYGIRPSGRARNLGASQAKGEFLFFFDDDIGLGHKEVVVNLIAPLKADPSIGLSGTSTLLPPKANPFQKRVGREIPRMVFPVLDKLTDSDMVTTQCWAQRKDNFLMVGGFSEEIERGVDPEYRHRVKSRGFRIVIAPNSWHYHPPPKDLVSLWKLSYRNGRASARAQKFHPELVTPLSLTGEADIGEGRSLSKRIIFSVWEVVRGIIRGRYLRVIERISYAMGFFAGKLSK
jgi:glycosyltransferase involved in cell wall biosynthesis